MADTVRPEEWSEAAGVSEFNASCTTLLFYHQQIEILRQLNHFRLFDRSKHGSRFDSKHSNVCAID